MRKFQFLLLAFSLLTIASPAKSNQQYAFIENKGQVVDQTRMPVPGVKYLLNTPGLNVQLRANGFSYDAYKVSIGAKPVFRSAAGTNWLNRSGESHIQTFHRVDINFPGANQHPLIIAESAEGDVLNYYTENGSFSNIHHFKKITYKNLYPGIDLEFVTRSDKPVEYNFIVHPGADPSVIRLQYSGASSTYLNKGTIINTTIHGNVEEHIPASFVRETGEQLTVSYKQTAPNVFSYSVPWYDKTKTLVIDPTPDIAWGTYYGGSGEDRGNDIVVDGSDIYTAGSSSSATNIATTGAYQTFVAGNNDAFITKFDRTGVRQWATYYGGSGADLALGAAAISGTICITGQTNSTAGIATPSANQTTFGGSYDAFLAKFSSSGTLQFGTYLGGSNIEFASSVAISTAGPVATIYVTGATASNNNIPTTNANQGTMGGVADAFLVKYSFTGFPIWGTYAGSTNLDEGYAVATDASGNVFIGGLTYQPTNNALVTAGAHQTTYGGDTTDYFLQKYNSIGQLQWGTYYGGSKGEERVDGEKLAIDGSGNVYFAGSTFSSGAIATPSSHQPSQPIAGGEDGFLAKFNNAGVLQWATYYGGQDGDLISAVATDNTGNVYVTGYTFSNTGIATTTAFQPNLNGTNLDAFLVKFNSGGGRLWASYYGGTDTEISESIATDAQANTYLTGYTFSSGGLTTVNAHQATIGGSNDAFIARIRSCNILSFSVSSTVQDVTCFGQADGIITIKGVGGTQPYLYKMGTVGGFQTTDTFKNLTPGTYNLTAMDDNGCTAIITPVIYEPVAIVTPTISGNTTLKQKDTATYTTPVQTGAVYQWSVTGGVIQSGQGTESIFVKWTQAGPGEVKLRVSGSATSLCPDSASITMLVDFPDHVDDIAKQGIRCYPNPAYEHLDIALTTVHPGDMLYVFDTHGRLVMKQAAQTNQALDIRNLRVGIYTVVTTNGERAQFVKL